MEPRYLAFDLEIAKEIPAGASDWQEFRPFGIACAAALGDGMAQPVFWHDTAPAALSRERCQGLVLELMSYVAHGFTLLTFNGLGFDLDVLAEESGLPEQCAQLAVGQHVDIMFDFFCRRGHAVSLDKAARGAGLAGKPPGMSGALAPAMWRQGQQDEVLSYLANDVRTTLDLAHAITQQGAVHWISQSGRPNVCPVPLLLTVRQALELPEPDTSTMLSPWPRSKFTAWLSERCPNIRPAHAHCWHVEEDSGAAGWYRIACNCGEVYSPRKVLCQLAKAGEVIRL